MKCVCPVCFRHCALEEGQTGFCRARGNRGGRSVCLNYGLLTSLALDPVEKKPLRRFFPGSLVLSAGSFGCNLRCPFCQNSEISMAGAGEVRTAFVSPRALAEKAEVLRCRGNIGLAFTYNEPLTGYEYVRDCALISREMGMKNVLVTNGTAEEPVLRELLPLIDAANIDLKGFTPGAYEKLGGDLACVKRAIALAAETCHVEVTTLVVPGLNDSEAEMRDEAAWLASIDPEIPLHVTRFFPRWRMADALPTPPETVRRLAAAAGEKLRYVYTGNL